MRAGQKMSCSATETDTRANRHQLTGARPDRTAYDAARGRPHDRAGSTAGAAAVGGIGTVERLAAGQQQAGKPNKKNAIYGYSSCTRNFAEH